MRDDNIRRLLHYSKFERYTALQDEGEKREDVLRKKLTCHYAILKQSDQPNVARAIEQTLYPLGVQALWVEDFDVIAYQLEMLYGTQDWQAVF